MSRPAMCYPGKERTVRCMGFLLLAIVACVTADAAAGNPDSAPLPPPSMDELTIPSGGIPLNGLIYLAGGPGPHPVVIFLHGYPGNERNLDLAQAVRRAGYHAVYFDYRGAWGTGGTFALSNGLEDLDSVLAWVRTPENATRYAIDISRIALVGHSYGGWIVLMHGGKEPVGVCIVALAAHNSGWAARRFAEYPEERKATLDYFQLTTTPPSGPIKADADQLLHEMVSNAEQWDYLAQAPALKNHALLLVAATRDSIEEDVAMHAQLAELIGDTGVPSPPVLTFDDDHSFSASREELATALVAWLNADCAVRQQAAASK